MGGLGSALAVRSSFDFQAVEVTGKRSNVLTVDFALTEVGYTIVRLLLAFPNIKLPKGQKVAVIGVSNALTQSRWSRNAMLMNG